MEDLSIGAYEVYFPKANRDEIVYRSGEIGLVGHCRCCGSMVIRGLWQAHVVWHSDIASEA